MSFQLTHKINPVDGDQVITSDKLKVINLKQILGYFRLNQILEIIPISASTWWAGIKSGIFPSPVNLGSRSTYWRKEDIFALIVKIINGEFNY